MNNTYNDNRILIVYSLVDVHTQALTKNNSRYTWQRLLAGLVY